jgi:YD repeat-containing protein
VQYSYDSIGRIQDVTDHTGAVTRYTYDLRGGLTKVTADYGTGNAKDTTYTLNANGAVTKQTLPSGHYNDYVYDDGGRVTSQTFKTSGGTTVDSYSYNYSPTGLPSYTTGYTRTENNGDVYTFVFDRMGRMKQEKKVDSALTTLYQQDFTYDKNGNRSTMQQQGSGAYEPIKSQTAVAAAASGSGRVTCARTAAKSARSFAAADGSVSSLRACALRFACVYFSATSSGTTSRPAMRFGNA